MPPFTRSRPAVAAALAILVAACGTAGPTSAPTTSPTTSPAPTARPTPTPTPTPSPTDSPTPAATPGFGQGGRIEIPDAGFAISLAEGWIAVPLDADDIQAIIDALPAGSELGALIQQQLPALLAAGVRLWAVDAAATTFASNLSVFQQPAAIPASLLRSFAEAGLATVPGIQGQPSIDDVEIGGVEGIRVSYEVVEPSTGITALGTQLYLTTGSSLFVITFTSDGSGDPAAIESMIDSIEIAG